MVYTQLNNTHAYQWQELSNGWWCGKGFLDDKVFDKTIIEQALESCESKDDIIELLQKMNGFFSLIWTINETTFVAVDYARSFPLFWKSMDAKTQLSDHLDKQTAEPSIWLNNNSLGHSVFPPGHTTFLNAWNQLQAGELLEIKHGICYLHTWFDHHRKSDSTDNLTAKDKQYWQNNFQELITLQMQRFIQWANGRTIVIPLSGGYDSRYILAGLLEAGYTNIKAFTYGLENSQEVKTVKKIVKELSIDWIFVPYTATLLDRFFSKEWEEYVDFSCNMAGLPQDQDFFALSYLKETGWLKTGDIISPGYCGDFQAGSYHPGDYFKFPWRKTKALQKFLYHKFVTDADDKMEQLWTFYLPKAERRTEEEIISELEHWTLREYVSKYILNGVRCYEFFDCDWYLPLWDKDFILFWQQVPNHLRLNMKLYRKTLEDRLFQPMNILFPEDHLPSKGIELSNMIGSKWKQKMKNYRPDFFAKPTESDDNGFSHLTQAIKTQLGLLSDEVPLTHNQVVGLWLDNYLKK